KRPTCCTRTTACWRPPRRRVWCWHWPACWVRSPCAPPARSARSAAGQASSEVARDLIEPDPLLRHRVALPNRHGKIVKGLEVDRHAVRRADLVLTPIAPADGTGIVEVDVPRPTQLGCEVARLR